MKTAQSAIVVSAMLILLLAGSCSNPTQVWIKIEPKDKNFSVLMPHKPKDSLVTRYYNGNPYECHTLICNSRNKNTNIRFFEIDYIDAKGIGQYKDETLRTLFVARLTEERVRYYNALFVSGDRTTLDGYPADEVRLMSQDYKILYIIRFAIADDKIFNLTVATNPIYNNSAEVDGFFDSFKIIQKAATERPLS